MTRLTLFTDGGCQNSGKPWAKGSMGGAILDEKETVLETFSERVYVKKGTLTNNICEYQSLIRGLQLVKSKYPAVKHLHVKMDSKLVICQTLGEWKINFPHLKVLRQQVVTLLKQFPSYTLEWIPRELNSLADSLADRALCAF